MEITFSIVIAFTNSLYNDYGNWKILKITGPDSPFASYEQNYGSTLVTSPTTKGVILIGGSINHRFEKSCLLYELSGDAEDNLTWSLLEQKLNTDRSFCIAKKSFEKIVAANRIVPLIGL